MIEPYSEPKADLEPGNNAPGEAHVRMEPEKGFDTGNQALMEPLGRLEIEVEHLPDPIGEDLNVPGAVDSPRPEALKVPQTGVWNSIPSRGEASTSREGEWMDSLREGSLSCPLEALLQVLPEKFMSVPRIGSSGELAEAVLHAQFQVSLMSK
jgi:hypothetical protein